MTKKLYLRLAYRNISANSRIYIPFVITSVLTVMMFFVMQSIALNPEIDKIYGAETMRQIFSLGYWVVGLFAIIFLFYTYSFLFKKRKKEFGLYSVLGLEKKHISTVLFWETCIISILSIVLGIILGIMVQKLLFMIILKVLDASPIMGIYVGTNSIISTTVLFIVIFVLIFLNSIRQVHLTNITSMLKGSDMGEREPRSKFLLSIIGMISIGCGYYISLTTKDPVTALVFFFVAVILVIIGTYLLFIAISITFIKFLKHKKNIYYKSSNFVSISGMLYRMKQNAVGLANICILSTMVLVTLSSTVSMFIGIEKTIESRYPTEYLISTQNFEEQRINNDKYQEAFYNGAMKAVEDNTEIEESNKYDYIQFSAIENGSKYIAEDLLKAEGVNETGNIAVLYFMTLEDYNKMNNTNKTLEKNQVLIYDNRKNDYKYDEITVFDKTFRIKEKLDEGEMIKNGRTEAFVYKTNYIVVKDEEILNNICKVQKDLYKGNASEISTLWIFDVNGNEDIVNEKLQGYIKNAENENLTIFYEFRNDEVMWIKSMYSGLLFVGIFLSILFASATILIIYYKQISEGYEDRHRYSILQKVGMGKEEIKKSINSQVLTVFFMPLITAGIHMLVAFPFIDKILTMLAVQNTTIHMVSTISVFIVFAIIYALVYKVTAKIYYSIVRQ